jgi:hypothetical protein
MKNKLVLPLRGNFEKNLNSLDLIFKYKAILERGDKHKYLSIQLEIFNEKLDFCHHTSLCKIPISEFISPRGYDINHLVHVQETIRLEFQIKNVKQGCGNGTEIIFDIKECLGEYSSSKSSNIPFNIPEIKNLFNAESFKQNKSNVETNIKEITFYIENYFQSLLSLSPSKITYANYEGIVNIFNVVAKNLANSHGDHKELNKVIHKWCCFIKDNYDGELDNIIISSNKFSTSVQIFQDKIESVTEGSDWKKVFIDDLKFTHEHNHCETKEENDDNYSDISSKCNTDDITTTSLKNNSDSLKNYRFCSKYTHEYNNTCHVKKCKKYNIPIPDYSIERSYKEMDFNKLNKYISIVNEMYFSINSEYPEMNELIYYTSLLEKKEVNTENLYKLLLL